MLTVEELAAGEEAAWDNFVAATPGGHLHQCLFWALPLTAYGVRTRVVACRVDGRIVGGALLRTFGLPLLGSAVTECWEGPLFASWDPAWARPLLDALREATRAAGSLAVRLHTCPREDLHRDLLAALDGARLRAELTPTSPRAVVPLGGRSLDEIRRGFHTSTRRMVRKGEAAVTVRPLTVAEIPAAHETWMATARRKGFTDVRPLPALASSLRAAIEQQRGVILGSFRDGRLLASIFVSHLGGEAEYVYGGYLDGAEEHHPTHVLHLEAIRGALDRRLSVYRLGELVGGGDVAHGVDQFKLGFGARAAPALPTVTWARHRLTWRAVLRLKEGRFGPMLTDLLRRAATRRAALHGSRPSPPA